MGTGFLAAACMILLLSQGPADVFYTNQRNHRIPVNIQESRRPDIRELLLYASKDQGRSWEQAAVIRPDKDSFAFYAPGDGSYWLRVAYVSRSGKQEPDDKSLKNGPPDLQMLIDTVRPVVKSFQAQRVGDEIAVAWEIQEEHPDLGRDALRIEYQVKDSVGGIWTTLPIAAAMAGKTTFRPTTQQPLVFRLSVRDLAGNQSSGLAEVAGTIAAAGFTAPSDSGNKVPMLPQDLALPKPPVEVSKPILPPPTFDAIPPKALFGDPPPPLVTTPKNKTVEKTPADLKLPPMPEPLKAAPRELPVAPPPVKPHAGDDLDLKPIANAAPQRKPLAPLQYVKSHSVMLQYKLNRVGPSGIGGVELWLTKDDGESWERYAVDEDVSPGAMQGIQERKFDLRDKDTDAPFPDGIYGMALVVKNRAGMGKKPRPGDAPEIRIEVDTQAPTIGLFQPVADPQRPDQLLLRWTARDKNLGDAPIALEYSDKREGPWTAIKVDLENTGRYANQHVTGDYSWKVPANIPVQVFLRMRVADKAGNESIFVTAEAQYVDLVEPEGALIGVQSQPKRP